MDDLCLTAPGHHKASRPQRVSGLLPHRTGFPRNHGFIDFNTVRKQHFTVRTDLISIFHGDQIIHHQIFNRNIFKNSVTADTYLACRNHRQAVNQLFNF